MSHKLVFGVINQDGGIEHQSGEIASAKRLNQGRFKVVFHNGTFDQEPVVTATLMTETRECGQKGTNRTISVTNVSSTEVCLGIRRADANDKSSDRPFGIIAVGA